MVRIHPPQYRPNDRPRNHFGCAAGFSSHEREVPLVCHRVCVLFRHPSAATALRKMLTPIRRLGERGRGPRAPLAAPPMLAYRLSG